MPWSAVMQPFCGSEYLMPSGASRAALACSGVMCLYSSSLLITVLRRVCAACGWAIGSYAVGFCTRPASIAASGTVRSLALLLKYRLAAASTPYAWWP